MVSSLLTLLKEWWFQRRKNKGERDYLIVLVSCALDTYARQCAEVVADDGLYHGQTDPDGHRCIQTDTPKFELEKLNVEWKTLPSRLLHQIWNLPNQAESAQKVVESTFEHCCSPLDSAEGFEERRFQYAKLGLLAADLAEQLRELAKLDAPTTQHWNPIKFMREQLAEMEAYRLEREKLHALRLCSIVSSD